MVRVVVLGGSSVATPELAAALTASAGRTRPIELVLVGRDADKLATVAAVTGGLAGDDSLLTVSHMTNVEAALDGAQYVINQVRVGGLRARAFDETFPHAFGLPGEETVGPGGFANASRTIPVTLVYARLMERICPTALLLNFANPASLVQYAVAHYSSARVVGLCNGPVLVAEAIAAALGISPVELTVDYAGMHHFGWVTGVWHHGRDLLPAALARAEQITPEVDAEIIRALGVIPGPYLNYVFHPDRLLAKKQGKRARAEELIDLQNELMADYAQAAAAGRMPAGLAKRKARWYRDIIVPFLLARVEETSIRLAVNVVNNGAVPWLPPEAIVELPALIEGGRIRPITVTPPPPDIQALIQANCAYEMLAAEAIVERDRSRALRALLISPFVHTFDQAAQTLEHAWKDESA
jgi:6-phospho-beta-glucosidase